MKKITTILLFVFCALNIKAQIHPITGIIEAPTLRSVLISVDTFSGFRFNYDSIRLDIVSDSLYFTDDIAVDLSTFTNDGYSTAGSWDDANNEIDITVDTPGSNYSIDMQAVMDSINAGGGGSPWTGTGGVIYPTTLTDRVGIGTTVPAAMLQIKGTGATSATDALIVENSALTDLFHIDNGGGVGINQSTPSRVLDVVGTMNLNDGLNNIFISGGNETTTGSQNVGIGGSSLSATTTGSQNFGGGFQSLYSNLTGSRNFALSKDALYSNESGNDNFAAGYQSLQYNISGGFNLALGRQSLRNCIGSNNISVGYQAGYGITSGVRNNSIGDFSLYAVGTGSDNIAMGYVSGATTTGSNNIFLGKQAGRYATGSNNFYIGSTTVTNEANGKLEAIIRGEMSETTANQNLYFNADVAIKTLGVAPTASLQIQGSGATSATDALIVENSALTDLFHIEDGGNIGINDSTPDALLDIENTTKANIMLGDGTYNWEISQTNADGHGRLKSSEDKDFRFEDSAGSAALIVSTFNGDIIPGAIRLNNGTTDKNVMKKTSSGAGIQIGSTTIADWDRIYLADDVGINIDTPTSQLHINENSTGANTISITNDDTGETSGDGLQIGLTATEEGAINVKENNDLYLATNNTIRIHIENGGNIGVGTSAPTEMLDINSDAIRIRTAQTPASASATGTTGMIAWDANYIYVCTATNTWVRASLATW